MRRSYHGVHLRTQTDRSTAAKDDEAYHGKSEAVISERSSIRAWREVDNIILCCRNPGNLLYLGFPNFDSVAPMLRQMMAAGWNTEVIPVEKSEVAIANMEKAMQTMQAPAMAR